jgi:DNA modification methylase
MSRHKGHNRMTTPVKTPDLLLHGDCLDQLKGLPDNSVDQIVTDPPYGYSFMGKDWDKAVPSVEIWQECLRVLKPGAFAFVMSAPRSDVLSRMIVRLEDAGFRVDFTPIYWTYASGFPKAMNIGKMVDKRAGAERPIIGKRTDRAASPVSNIRGGRLHAGGSEAGTFDNSNITATATPEAKALDGSYGGFQPKPAVEVIIVAMKPLSEKTYVDQALKSGKGITWLDDCRVPTRESTERPSYGLNSYGGYGSLESSGGHNAGRFPANLLVSDDVLADHSRFFSLDSWADTLPFLAVPKASKGEKNEGLDDRESVTVGDGRPVPIDNAFQRGKTERKNSHPTVKPLKLMSYLITLGSRKGNTVLDPFLGSGTTALAAQQLGRRYIGIEREAEYIKIAEARLDAARPFQPTLTEELA